MTFDPDVFRQAVETLEAQQRDQEARATGGERRFSRFGARGEARILRDDPTDPRPTLVGMIRDISRGGVGVITNRPLRPGETAHLELRSGRLVAAVVPGVCRHCREVTATAHLVGMEFAAESALLLALGVPAEAIASTDLSETAIPAPGDFMDMDDWDHCAA